METGPRGRERGHYKGATGCPVVLPVREADDHEAGTLARDGPVGAAPSGARERLRGRPPGWLEPLLGG